MHSYMTSSDFALWALVGFLEFVILAVSIKTKLASSLTLLRPYLFFRCFYEVTLLAVCFLLPPKAYSDWFWSLEFIGYIFIGLVATEILTVASSPFLGNKLLYAFLSLTAMLSAIVLEVRTEKMSDLLRVEQFFSASVLGILLIQWRKLKAPHGGIVAGLSALVGSNFILSIIQKFGTWTYAQVVTLCHLHDAWEVVILALFLLLIVCESKKCEFYRGNAAKA